MNTSEKQLEHHEVKNSKRTDVVHILCEGMGNPENAGMVFRLADAFGVGKVHFLGERFSNEKKVRKTARGMEEQVPSEKQRSLAFIQILKEEGFTVIGIEITSASKDLRTIDFSKYPKKLLCVGSEKHGISPELLDLCDFSAHIPMFGQNTSINVVHALSIALYGSLPTFSEK